MITQVPDQEIKSALREYYEQGGYGSTPLGEGEFASKQADQVYSTLGQALEKADKKIQGSSFIEIGCAYGYLLHLLEKAGAKSILGVEPGKEGISGSEKYHIPMLRDFFPSDQIIGKYDVALTHLVLEHVEQPEVFIQETKRILAPDGLAFFAVPDCEKKLRIGDPSIISHQHLNYFTKSSLTNILEAAGFSEVEVVSSDERSMLYAWGSNKDAKKSEDLVQADGLEIFESFQQNLKKNLFGLQALIDGFEKNGQTIGMYAGSDVLIGSLEFKTEPRLFDTDVAKQGKFMSCSAQPVESPQNLLSDPVDVILVCAIDYDREITGFLESLGLGEKMRIISVKKIFEENSKLKYLIGSK